MLLHHLLSWLRSLAQSDCFYNRSNSPDSPMIPPSPQLSRTAHGLSPSWMLINLGRLGMTFAAFSPSLLTIGAPRRLVRSAALQSGPSFEFAHLSLSLSSYFTSSTDSNATADLLTCRIGRKRGSNRLREFRILPPSGLEWGVHTTSSQIIASTRGVRNGACLPFPSIHPFLSSLLWRNSTD